MQLSPLYPRTFTQLLPTPHNAHKAPPIPDFCGSPSLFIAYIGIPILGEILSTPCAPLRLVGLRGQGSTPASQTPRPFGLSGYEAGA